MKTTDILNGGYIKPETYNERPDHEVQMARSELYRAGKCAIELHNMLKHVSEQQGLEGWVQSKITKAADYLESVYHYLDYEMRNPSDEMDEASPVAPGAVPPGGVSTPGDAQTATANPANAALEKQKAAAAIALQKKQVQDQIKATQKQLQDLQKQMQTIGSVAQAQPMAEMGSAGASVSGGMAAAPGSVKDKKKVGSLFGGSYKQPAEDLSEIKKGEKDSNGYTKCWPGKHAEGTKKGKNGGRVRNCVPNESVNEAGSPAQQAAIAIAKKKSGKYNKDGERIREFAPSAGPERDDGGKPQFMEWQDFIAAIDNLVKSNFDVKQGFKNKKLEKSQASAKFIPHDPYAHGPVMVYTFKDRRPPYRTGVRAYTQIGAYGKHGEQLLTHYAAPQNNLREVYMTPENATMIAHAIMKNTGGALQDGVAEASYQGWVSNPQANLASRFAHDPDRAATIYKANKFDPKTGLGGYVANRASARDDTNIMIQLQSNLDSAYSKPIKFDDGSSLKIGPGTARKALNKLDAMKPVQRHDAVKNIVASKDAFVAFVKNEGVSEAAGKVLTRASPARRW